MYHFFCAYLEFFQLNSFQPQKVQWVAVFFVKKWLKTDALVFPNSVPVAL
jgi:hypothetical protein